MQLGKGKVMGDGVRKTQTPVGLRILKKEETGEEYR